MALLPESVRAPVTVIVPPTLFRDTLTLEAMPVIVKLAQVSVPDIANDPDVTPASVMLLNVSPPDGVARFGLAPDSEMVDVFSLKVIFVFEDPFQNTTLIVDAPSVSARVVDPVVVSVPHVTVCPFVSNVPAVKVIADVPLFHVPCTVHPPPAPLKVVAFAIVKELNVRVLPVAVELKVIAPVYVRVMSVLPPMRFSDPLMASAEDPAHVTLFPAPGPSMTKSRQTAASLTVTV